MELKQKSTSRLRQCPTLLIVPYGIETTADNGDNRHQGKLLIVPYGIETMRLHVSSYSFKGF